MFTTPCIIRKNTPELRQKLEILGYSNCIIEYPIFRRLRPVGRRYTPVDWRKLAKVRYFWGRNTTYCVDGTTGYRMEVAARPGKGNRQPYRQLGRIGSS